MYHGYHGTFVHITIHHGNHGYHGTKPMKYIGSLNNVFYCLGTMITMVTMVDGNLDKSTMVTMVHFCKGASSGF